jgi:hypothetical protein
MAKNKRYFTVAERNAWFASLTPAKKRIQIAKDVLAQLDAKVIEAQAGTYFLIENLDKKFNNKEIELQKILVGTNSACQCCAKGALFAAKVRNYNDCKVDVYGDCVAVAEGTMRRNLAEIFDQYQYDLIETAFEVDPSMNFHDDKRKNRKLIRAGYMYRDVDEAETRMRMIMQNIIKNRGTFVVPNLDDFDPDIQDFINQDYVTNEI